MKFIPPDIDRTFELHDEVKDRIFPFSGGSMEQPAILWQAFGIIDFFETLARSCT